MILLLVALFSSTLSLERTTRARFSFVDVTSAAGVDFVHVTGASGRKYLLETMGSGAVFFDYDGDFDPDLFLVNGGVLPGFSTAEPVRSVLYRNDGEGRFVSVTDRAGLADAGYGYGMGAIAADYDNDGDADLYVTTFGPNHLYRNNGDGTFTDVTETARVGNDLWSASAAWSDLDGDGLLDIYVTNYLDWSLENNPDCSVRRGDEILLSYCLPDSFQGLPDELYRNRADGTFEAVGEAAGISTPSGKGLGVVAFDYDGDGLADLYVANDTVPNFLFHNEGGMHFSQVGTESGVGYDELGNALAGMGVDVGDYDHDGDLDLFVTNFDGELNTLYRNDRNGFFTDVSVRSGVGHPSFRHLAFGAAFADLDNDSWLDLLVANGHLDNVDLLYEGSSYAQPNQVFRNSGENRFEEVHDSGLQSGEDGVSRGLALADIDGDFDLDILFTNSGARAELLRNDSPSGQSLRLLLVGRRANRSAVGARLLFDRGKGEEVYELRAGSSYLSQNELIVHVGLGERSRLEGLTISWPGSSEEVIGALPAGRLSVLVEGLGVVASFPLQ